MKPRASVWPQRFVQWEPEPVGQVGPWGSHQAPVFPSRLQGVMGGSEHPAEPGPVSMGPGPGLGSAQRQPYSGSSEDLVLHSQKWGSALSSCLLIPSGHPREHTAPRGTRETGRPQPQRVCVRGRFPLTLGREAGKVASRATAQPGGSVSSPAFSLGGPVSTPRDRPGLCRDPHSIRRGFSSSWEMQLHVSTAGPNSLVLRPPGPHRAPLAAPQPPSLPLPHRHLPCSWPGPAVWEERAA